MKKITFPALALLLFIQCAKPEPDDVLSQNIRINQLGFYPGSVKEFVVADQDAETFDLVNSKNWIVFSGKLESHGSWKSSGENVLYGDFSGFSDTGSYQVVLNNGLHSNTFEIKEHLYRDALHAAIKSYYFQRASTPIEESYGGIYGRAAGHPDDACLYHPSSGRTEGVLEASGGWYDAGDYGKYTVNASLSVGQMLLLLEQFPEAVPDASLNIPESGNGRSDLWDELKYELDWILKMQDADGGVYHKLTAKGFSDFIMPADYDLDRYIIGRSTSASLNFAAVLAQAARLMNNSDPEWAAKALLAAERAWTWSLNNPSTAFSNPEDVSTGEYGDDVFDDDFYWAAAELYLTTGKPEYLEHLQSNEQQYRHQLTNSWKFFVRNNGFHSLLQNADRIPADYANSLKESHRSLADSILGAVAANPYRIGLDRFEWGSNSDVLNQAMILCMAHRITGEEKYLMGAERINDYIYGKNATGYCFLTGFGSKRVMFPHHRPSGADGIAEPVPGFIAGGPNNDRQDQSEVNYVSDFPAKAYVDAEPSFASNEVCLNWNAPAVYVLGYLEQARN